jgi:predicted HTH transcriptional regulator
MLSKIIECLKNNGAVTAGEVSALLGIDRTLIEMGLHELQSKGRVEKIESKKTCSGCSMCNCGMENNTEYFAIPGNSCK